jgi:FKBP-type peptidyl-prolyl cis-trans isomerase
VRRIAASLAVPLLIVSAVACGGDGDGKGSSDDTFNGPTKNGVPAVQGAADAKPQIAKGEGDPPKQLKTKVLKEGTGETVRKGDALTAHYLGQTWQGKVFDNSWDRGKPTIFEIGVGKVVPGWDEGLVGQKVGSRVELVLPPDKGYGDTPREGSGIEPGDTLVFVVDIKNAFASAPKGQKVPQNDAALPKVGTNTDGKTPAVTIPKNAKAPADITAKTLIKGTGREVNATDTIAAHYSVTLWNGQPGGGDTWSQGSPQEVKVDQLPGWKQALSGQKAGSRVMIVVPKDKLTAEQQKNIGTDVVFVVDVLDVV